MKAHDLRRLAAIALAAALVASVREARAADPTPSDEEVERARTFFNAGAQAYSAGKYTDAVRSFEQAYVLAPRPQVLFSLAQAEKKEFLDLGNVRALRHAIQHYKEYLEKVPSGGRHDEALDAKTELESRASRLDPQQAQAPAAPEREKRKPRVTVYSPIVGAHASLDGGPPQELPYFADLEPGKHRVRVFADGYFDAEREVSGDRGTDVPVDLPLREKPAIVTVAAAGGDIYVDGRLVSNVGRPIEVPAGVRVISVVKNGRKPASVEVGLERGKPFRWEPKLETSGQRLLAWTMIGVGGTSLLLGGLSALGALGAQNDARDIEERRSRENIAADDVREHERLVNQRDDARTAAIVFSSVGAAVLGGGALLYLFDTPPVAVLPPRSVEPGAPKPKEPLELGSSLSGLRPFPLLGPSTVGAGVVTTF